MALAWIPSLSTFLALTARVVPAKSSPIKTHAHSGQIPILLNKKNPPNFVSSLVRLLFKGSGSLFEVALPFIRRLSTPGIIIDYEVPATTSLMVRRDG